MSKLTRGKQGESKVKDTLSKIDAYHLFLNDYTYINPKTKISHQIDHILIHPYGVFIIETKNYYGTLDSNYGDSIWIKRVKGVESTITNPLIQNRSHWSIIYHLLDKKVDCVSVVVLVRDNAPYMPDDNVINLSDLSLFIDSYPYKKLLSKDDIDKIYVILKKYESNISKKDHLSNIKKVKEKNKGILEDRRIAIEENKCPKCDNRITVKGYTYSCKKCGYHFELK